MRTNREGNLKRFFDIQSYDRVLEVCGDVAAIPAMEYDYIFWNPTGAADKEICVRALFTALSQEGTLVVSFDNPYSVHAFAQGMRAVDRADVSYPLIASLQKSLKEGGESFYAKCYYPYPDVMSPCAFFSDDRLPEHGECGDNFYNFDCARLEAFDERSVTDRITEGGMYPYLANAYMLILSKTEKDDLPVYTRFSNERREDAQIRTDLYKDRVVKCAVCPQAVNHVLAMRDMQNSLSECLKEMQLLGRDCSINEVLSADKKSVSFAFAEGESLEQTLDRMLAEGKEAEVTGVLLAFCKGLCQNRSLSDFSVTDSFREIFSELKDWQDYGFKSLPVTDVDLVAQNILLGEKAVIIDYEWTFDFPVPVEFLVFRFLYFYLEAKNRVCPLPSEDIYSKAGITPEMKEIFLAMETAFQHYVQCGAKVLCNSFDEEGKPVLTCADIERQVKKLDGKTIRVGEAQPMTAKRSPEGVYLYKIPKAEEKTRVLLEGFDVTESGSCVLRLGAMADCGGVHTGLSYETNGVHLGGLLYLYENVCPEMVLFGVSGEEAGEKPEGAEISIEEIEMSEASLSELATTIADMRFIIDNREQQIRDLKNSASWKVTKPLRALKGNKE